MVQRGREWRRVTREFESRLTWRLPKIKSDANTNVAKEIKISESGLLDFYRLYNETRTWM